LSGCVFFRFAAKELVRRVRVVARLAFPAIRCVPGEEMLRMDFVMLVVDMLERWVERDHGGIAGMPSGWVCPFSERAVV
jgi:hypothetical protein